MLLMTKFMQMTKHLHFPLHIFTYLTVNTVKYFYFIASIMIYTIIFKRKLKVYFITKIKLYLLMDKI